LTRHQSAGRGRFSGVAAIGLRPTLAVIAVATLTFAQAPTEEARVLMGSDPAAAAIAAASGPTANADAQPVQNPGIDLVSASVVSFRPYEVQN